MAQRYYSLDELINVIPEPNRTACNKILQENAETFRIARGSSHNHQYWQGGYLDHLREIMNLAVVFYRTLNGLRPLEFSLSDALLALYLHDLEKPWRYQTDEQGNCVVNPALADKKKTALPFVEQKIKEYGFVLNDEHWNAVKYAEGEKNDYSPGKRTSTPLAAFVHLCDSWSARGWYDFPKKENDTWRGAKREFKP
jgi:hypothetical protein